MGKLAIDQSSNSTPPCGVMVTMMAIWLSESLVTTYPTNGVFDHNPPFGKGGVIGDVIGWTRRTRWFATRRSARAELVDAHISQVTHPAHACGQTLQQGRLFQQRKVSGWASHTVGPIHELACFLVNGDLAFERMALFL